MRVTAMPGDSPAEIAVMAEIEYAWQNTLRLKAEIEASFKTEGLLGAKLRKLQEGLVEGEELTLKGSKQRGLLESTPVSPYLWLRLLDKTGCPTKRLIKLDERADVTRPDGSVPTQLHPDPAF
jgi:hypothetical protein